MNAGTEEKVIASLETLTTDLIELAFTLECRGQLEAADVALMVRSRVNEIRAEAVVLADSRLHVGRAGAPSGS